MSSQRRRHRKRSRAAAVLRPALLVAVLAAVLVAAIAGVSTLSSRAVASSRTAARQAHGKDTKGAKQAAGSMATPSRSAEPTAPTDPQAATDTPVAQLPSPDAASSSGDQASPSAAAPSATDTPADTRAVPTTATAPAGAEANRVGALFTGAASPGNHFCTASVVHSAGRNLLLTAAHCLSGAAGVTFAPGYRDGRSPFGVWQATQVFQTNGWTQNQDPDQDFAFLQVAPNASGQQIEDVLGGNVLGTDESFTAPVRLYGYPDSGDEPLLCSNTTTKQSAYQRRIDCPSYSGGTSGGPWISTDTGHVTGVIGGYQQGGDTDDTSYTAYFDSTIAGLYQTAVSAAS
ncbi:serine protease [Streptomyces tateyamensis]|uniref:Serine protease n=1 Tax=Streptomyces tateyamensis TaxID=565073 RepID=A0A2V4P9F0_9ACTN|nr:serine protease [Streptomyces tateyamensis]PYC81570.1 serine protease [Streptomyces tateyamensis]